MVNFTFSRKLRLLKSDHFKFVFSKPQYSINTINFSILNRSNKLQIPRIGLIVSKKIVKLSHERNRIKRLVRESFRLRQKILCNMDFIILIRKNISKTSNYEIVKELEILWCHYYR